MKNKFPYRYRVLLLLFFLIVVTFLDRVCISIVGVRVKSEFHLSNTQFGWVLGAFSLSYALFEIPAGMLGDRIGQRKVLARIVLWWSLFTALTGVVSTFFTLILTRFLFGMGEAGAFPNASGVISRWLPSKETSRGTAIMILGTSVGSAIAPLLIVPLALAYGWRAPFFVNALIGVVWVLAWLIWFRDEPSEMKKISVNELELIEETRRHQTQHTPLPWLYMLRNKSLMALCSAFFCSQWAFYFFVAWMPVYLQQGRQLSENQMKISTSYLFIFGMAGALFTGFFCDWLVKKKGVKFARKSVGIACLLIMGILFFAAASIRDNSIAMDCLMFSYFFIPANGINGFSTCIDIGKNKAGTVAGMMNFSGNLGAFFLAILFGTIVDFTHNYNTPLYLISAMLIIGSMFWLSVDPSKELNAELIKPHLINN